MDSRARDISLDEKHSLNNGSYSAVTDEGSPTAMGRRSHNKTSPRRSIIFAVADHTPTPRVFSGGKKKWPGAVLLICSLIALIVLITYFAVDAYNKKLKRQDRDKDDNPIVPTSCEHTNYTTDGKGIYAISAAGNKMNVKFRGANWFGMEDEGGVPYGLAHGQNSIRDITESLSQNGFNAVRLPLAAKNVIKNIVPNTKKYIDQQLNGGLAKIGTYIEMIQQVAAALGNKKIGVLLDIHKLDPLFIEGGGEGLWYTSNFSTDYFLRTIDVLTENLCNSSYWNIIGIDIKNEPKDACWPVTRDTTDPGCSEQNDWRYWSEVFGNRVLLKCPQWLIFVEGLYAIDMSIPGNPNSYNDWSGASLQNARSNGVQLSCPNKLVYAPHFYSPSVYPVAYCFEQVDIVSHRYIEFDQSVTGNQTLKARVQQVMNRAFGAVSENMPMVLGEFGGIYGAADESLQRTSSRTIQYIIEYAKELEFAGAFVWSLNPDSHYAYNKEYDAAGFFSYGLYDNTWKQYHSDYLDLLKSIQSSGSLPCYN